MKSLSEHYYLVFVDIIGMGGSSRPDFNIQDDYHIVNEYLISWFESWRIKMGDIT